MIQKWRWLGLAALLAAGLLGGPLGAQEDVADVPFEDLRAGKDESKRYFLIGPAKGAQKPAAGEGLLIVMPGGAGGADMHPFVKRIFMHAVPAGYVAAQPVAVKWTADQKIIWPTDKSRVPMMKFTTEEFVAAVIEDVESRRKIDPARIFTLSWSSSGPAAYAISLTSKKVTGSFVAMSVYKPESLPDLKKAKGHGYYLYHSPDDKVCPYPMAERAARELEKQQARVKLTSYVGGHGWKGPLYQDIRTGIQWLEKNTVKADGK